MYGRSAGVAPLVKQLILYTGPQCHLCEQAKAVLDPLLAQKGWDLVEVSIAEDDRFTEAYGLRIPVVAMPNGDEKGWPFTVFQIERMLEAVI